MVHVSINDMLSFISHLFISYHHLVWWWVTSIGQIIPKSYDQVSNPHAWPLQLQYILKVHKSLNHIYNSEQNHSVESPSRVDPQWNIWYWGSEWILHTVCWSAVGCEWGTISVYFGITYVCFIPSRLPVFAVESQYLLQYFLFLSKVSFEVHIQNLQKIHVGLKFEWGL